MTERSLLIEVDIGRDIRAVIFSADGKYLVSGDVENVRVWRVKDGEQMATMEAESVNCLAVSKDGRWIAAGTMLGVVFLWDAKTYEKVFAHEEDYSSIHGVDFSPNLTRLVSTSFKHTATVWDVTSRQPVLTLHHEQWVRAAKCSPQGDRIATATLNSVRVYNSNEARSFVDIKVNVTPLLNTGLLWFNNHLYVISDGKIKEFETSTGSAVSEWPVPDSNGFSCIALPKHGEFVAYSANRTVSLWDTSTHTQIALIQHPQDIRSIAFSPDDRFLAIGEQGGKITIKILKDILPSYSAVSVVYSYNGFTANTPTFLFNVEIDRFISQLPFIAISNTALELWKHDRLKDTVASLSATINISRNQSHHALARERSYKRVWEIVVTWQWKMPKRRVLICLPTRSCSLQITCSKSIAIRPSVIGYIAKSVVLILGGKIAEGCRVYDLAFRYCRPDDVDLLLLIKAVVLFMAGKYDDAIARVGDLIAAVHLNSIFYVVQAYMHYLVNSLQSFERARAQMRHCEGSRLFVISLISGWKFDGLDITIHQHLCDALYAAGRMKEAGESLLKMVCAMNKEADMSGPIAEWVTTFKRRCLEQLESLGDTSMDADDAISHYSVALSLDPTTPQRLFVKPSQAHVTRGLWEEALNDANKVIELDPLSPWGHERKHAALHKAGDYVHAIHAFEAMLSMMSQSSDLEIRERHSKYVIPEETRAAIRRAVQNVIHDSPRVLINTVSGRFCAKSEQAASFESLAVCNKLISSMTTHIDHARIDHEVAQYYRYAMFSHRWEEEGEPLFENVIHIVVYDLEESLTHHKLQMFCKIVRDEGLYWAWSDTCCINKVDHFVLQEALVSMFKWYQCSAVTVVLLRGACSPSWRGDLVRCIWNTRAWTFQEYHASRVVQFYNEDWTLYRNLDIPNHRVTRDYLGDGGGNGYLGASLDGAPTWIRVKLCLASKRQTTLVEDAAYSLFGIFTISLPIVYSEGDQALGRLLAQLLASSGDTNILAWTGKPGSFNSCLPTNITVFSQLPPPHIPRSAETEMIAIGSRATALNPTWVTKFYDRLIDLPVPSFAGKRMNLPCIVFKLGLASAVRSASGRVFRALTVALGTVEIKTEENLSGLDSLCLVHPWIDFLLDRQPVGSVIETIPEENTDDRSSELPSFPGPSNITLTVPQTQTAGLASRFRLSFGGRATRHREAASLRPPASLSQADRQMLALRVIARLRQPFGALLLKPDSGNVKAYNRVAADSLITVQVEEITPTVLNKLVDGVRVLDVL